MTVFPATLGTREKLVTFGVGYGVGMGVPTILGLAFAIGFQNPWFLLFPLPFLAAFGAPYFLRPTGFGVSSTAFTVLRPGKPISIPLEDLQAALSPAPEPPGASIGVRRVSGIHGNFGTYWNRQWGHYRVYVTDATKRIELRLSDQSRLIVSPADPEAFLDALARLGIAVIRQGGSSA